MADLAVEYVLTTPSTDITFNDGALGDNTDKYWITAIRGLDGPSIRAPVDLVPFGDGGIVHAFWKGPRRVVVDGILLVEGIQDCQERRNDMATDLMAALDAIIAADGTFAWQATGQSALDLTVRCEVPLEIAYTDNYAVSTFSFGLISAAPDPA